MYAHTYGICHIIQRPLSVCLFSGVYKDGFRLDFSSNTGHFIALWSIFTVFYTYLLFWHTFLCILSYVFWHTFLCMYFEETTGPQALYGVESYGIREHT
jgi:hypothetical protein